MKDTEGGATDAAASGSGSTGDSGPMNIDAIAGEIEGTVEYQNETTPPQEAPQEFKDNLTQVLIDKITPISAEIKKLIKEEDYLDKILSEGCNQADNIASKKVKKIHEIVGF